MSGESEAWKVRVLMSFLTHYQGIWARVSFSDENAIIFLDTEGFFGQGASESYDGKHYTLLLLYFSLPFIFHFFILSKVINIWFSKDLCSHYTAELQVAVQLRQDD